MSWIDLIETTELEITTGDGKTYAPLWIGASKEIDYNTAGFDFIGQRGTFVKSGEVRGSRFPVTLFFQGEDNVETSRAFEESAKDTRPWSVSHPYHGVIRVRPVALTFDNSAHNTTKITGTLWETTDLEGPQQSASLPDAAELSNTELKTLVEADFTASLDPEAADLSTAAGAVTGIDAAYSKLATTAAEAKVYKDLVRTAAGAATGLINDTTSYINAVVTLLNYPATVAQSVERALDAMFEALDTLENTLRGSWEFYSNVVGAALGAVGEVAAKGSYAKRGDVLDVIDAYRTWFGRFKETQDENGIDQDSAAAFRLDVLVNAVLGNLILQAFDAKQERAVRIAAVTNLVTLAHRFFGAGDAELEQFISINNIQPSEFLELPQGREVYYYI